MARSRTDTSAAPVTTLAGADPDDRRLGESLVEHAGLDPGQLERALRLQRENGTALDTLLVHLGLVGERDVACARARCEGLALVDPAKYPLEPVFPGRLTRDFLLQARAVPLAVSPEGVIVAMADPRDRFTLEALGLALGLPVLPRVGTAADIEAAVRRQFGESGSAMADLVPEAAADDDPEGDDIAHLRDLASEAPIIRLVNLIIARALEGRASDIHIEPFEGKLKVRYRIDGVLREVEAPPVGSTAAVVSRIKVLAHLNIAERRLPQDGRIKVRIEGREIDMRIATVPTLHGESVVLRILDRGSVPLDFETLGFTGRRREELDAILSRPHGVVLVTGPTGSGKTTTLYAALHGLNTPDRKILTVEDPIEYRLEGVNQIQVKPRIGLGFASALRAILRQDPDVIMVGEMRDAETARIAVQAALTGHKVLSTLHTNDAASSVTRLLDMGIEDYLVTSTVNGVIAQRLVRTLCPHCKASIPAPTSLIDELGPSGLPSGRLEVHRPVGCARCDGTGFRGRTGIVELMVMTDALRAVVLERGDAPALRAAARGLGWVPMREDGLRKALAGLTTLEEVERVTHEG